MEHPTEKLDHILLAKKEKCIQNVLRWNEKRCQDTDQRLTSDNNDSLLDINFNKCCFCSKVFCNSKYLIQHILRRHSENLILMYKKLNDLNSSDRAAALNQKEIINVITSEFSKLRNDLELAGFSSLDNKFSSFTKETQTLETFEKRIKSEELVRLELQDFSRKVSKINADVKELKEQWKEFGDNFCDGSNIKQTDLYQILKHNLLYEFQNLISESNNEQKAFVNQHLSSIKTDMDRLEKLVKINAEKIDSPLLVQETLKKLENEIEFFLSCRKAKRVKAFQKSIYCNESKLSGEIREKDQIDESKKVFYSKQNLLGSPCKELNYSSAPSLLETKLKELNIPPETKRLSYNDYNAKLKIVKVEREILSNAFPSFPKIYHRLKSSLDNIASQKVKDKKSKRLRFCLSSKESLIRSNNEIKTEKLNTGFSDKEKKSADQCSSIELVCDRNNSNKNTITPVRISGNESVIFNSSYKPNSSASLKLIASANKQRQLPTLPQNLEKDLSNCESLESDN